MVKHNMIQYTLDISKALSSKKLWYPRAPNDSVFVSTQSEVLFPWLLCCVQYHIILNNDI